MDASGPVMTKRPVPLRAPFRVELAKGSLTRQPLNRIMYEGDIANVGRSFGGGYAGTGGTNHA